MSSKNDSDDKKLNFENAYKELNNEQKYVVDAIDRNIKVMAPAGTGKTKVMAMRVANLIRSGKEPASILCLTFTNKAAKEMKTRIEEYTAEADKVTIKTFHSFCYHIIMNDKDASHYTFPCTIIDEVDVQEIINDIRKECGIEPVVSDGLKEDQAVRCFKDYIEAIKKYSLNLDVSIRYEEEKLFNLFKNDKSNEYFTKYPYFYKTIEIHGLKLYKEYNKKLKENNSIDFTDLELEANYLMEIEEIREKWSTKFKYIQLDEMQDTSLREYDLIDRIANSEGLSLFGDLNQTIYEWRSSNPTLMLKQYDKDYVNEEIHLKTNYRSTQVLVDAAENFIRNDVNKDMMCKSVATEVGDKISIHSALKLDGEVKYIVKQIKDNNYNLGEVAILVRNNYTAKNISKLLTSYAINNITVEDINLFRQTEIKKLLSFYDYAINERNIRALKKIMQHPYIDANEQEIKGLLNSKEAFATLNDWVMCNSQDPYMLLENAYNLNEVVVLDVESTGLSTTQDEIVQIAAIRYGKDGYREDDIANTLNILLKTTKCVGDSQKVHHFTDEELQSKGLEPTVALNMLLDFIGDKVIVGHNIGYDMQIINSSLSRNNMPRITKNKIYDTLDLARKVYPNAANHKLGFLYNQLEMEHEPTHNALDDIIATAELLSHLLEIILTKADDRRNLMEQYYCYMIPYANKIKDIRKHILDLSLEESLVYLMNDLNFKKYYTKEQMISFRQLCKVIRMLDSRRTHKVDNIDEIIELLTFSALSPSEMERSEIYKDAVAVTTVHQAKGLEYKVVFIAGCNDGIFPSRRSLNENRLSEEHRLFYVAMTRAKAKLYITYDVTNKTSIFTTTIPKRFVQYDA